MTHPSRVPNYILGFDPAFGAKEQTQTANGGIVRDMPDLRLERDGYAAFERLLEPERVAEINRELDAIRIRGAGLRNALDVASRARALVASTGLKLAEELLGAPAFVVRAIVFQK